ncbi:MAG: DUF4331 family protein, partial [Candidatus Eremiobacteraeota bacterium]|nr:DUF4331 family protein [Candidatus Eremiobacteraeota bacterium]
MTAVVALTAAGVLYAAHPVKSSDHQDTYNLATRSNTSADITDVFVYQAPDNANNVVFAMDTTPLVAPGAGLSHFFDPTLMYQFKISHQASGKEDEVIQIGVTGTTASQTLTLYGPNKPNEVGTTNTFVGQTGPFGFNQAATLAGGTIQAYAGPRTDPFFFDLFAFFTFLGDRNYGTHTSQSDPGPETAGNPEGLSDGDTASNLSGLAPSYDQTGNTPGPNPPAHASFNGFAAGTQSNVSLTGATTTPGLGAYACSTNPASDTLFAGPFNVEAIVIEVPKSLLTTASLNSAGSTSS